MPGGLTLLAGTSASIPTPPAGKVTIFFNTDTNLPSYKNSSGIVFGLVGSQGVIGSMGIQGEQGDEPDVPIALPGPQGNPGTTGATGPVGPMMIVEDGIDGEDGLFIVKSGSDSPWIFESRTVGDVLTGADILFVDVTGLVFTYEENSFYWIEIFGSTSAAAATTGFNIAFNTSTAVNRVMVHFINPLAIGGTLTGGSSILVDSSLSISSGRVGTGLTPFIAQGQLITGAGQSGTAQLRLRSEVAAVVTMQLGTMMRVRKQP